jgi:hypothetical protein
MALHRGKDRRGPARRGPQEEGLIDPTTRRARSVSRARGAARWREGGATVRGERERDRCSRIWLLIRCVMYGVSKARRREDGRTWPGDPPNASRERERGRWSLRR